MALQSEVHAQEAREENKVTALRRAVLDGDFKAVKRLTLENADLDA